MIIVLGKSVDLPIFPTTILLITNQFSVLTRCAFLFCCVSRLVARRMIGSISVTIRDILWGELLGELSESEQTQSWHFEIIMQ
jgi:hypothetical protein